MSMLSPSCPPPRRLVCLLVLSALPLAPLPASDLSVDFSSDVTTEAKPWTNLDFQNNPDNFQFAVVSDRTGGPRDGVFEDAVKKLNWLMPEFVLSVGDLIKGTSENARTNAAEWDEFMAMVAPLKMPFFFVPGNHDIQMKWLKRRVQPEEMQAQWQERFGTTYYSFVYKNVLFVALFSNDGKEQYISGDQAAYFEEVIARHPDVRWTFVLLHHPLWAYPQESNFDRIEAALAGRRHTVLAGHHHRYVHFDRNDTDYIILGSTGGSSPLRGNAFGEFDHVSWFTMTDEGPVMANLRLDGILPRDISKVESLEWVAGLSQSSDIGTAVLLDPAPDGTVRAGAVFLTLTNKANHPLRLDGEFRHSHHVHPEPGLITRVLPPHTAEVVEVDLEIMQPFAAKDNVLLEFRTVMSFDDVEVPGLEVRKTTVVPLRARRLEVFDTESIEFPGATSVASRFERDGRIVRVTTDGSEPTAASPRLDGPYDVTADTVLKARVFTRGGLAGPVDELTLVRIPAGGGLLAHYYEHETSGGHVNQMPIFPGLPPTLTRRVSNFDLRQIARRAEDFAVVFYGSLEITEPGNYGFHMDSADGARLFIDGELIINDSIKHPLHEVSGFAELGAGRHAITVQFFQANRDSHLALDYTPPDGNRHPIPEAALSFDAASEPVLSAPLVVDEPAN